jgi:hypothetical protein
MVDRLRSMRPLPFVLIPLLQQLLHLARRVGFLQRGIHGDFEIGRVKDLKGETFKQEIPYLWMVEHFSPFLSTQDFMIRPPGAKFRAAELEIMDQLRQLGISRITTTTASELC